MLIAYSFAGQMEGPGPGHYKNDVAPVIFANILDGGDDVSMWWPTTHLKNPPGVNVLEYYKVRPTLHNNCPKNPK